MATLSTSKKKLFTADYEIHASIKMLYPYIQTASGLSEWFADDVTINNNKSGNGGNVPGSGVGGGDGGGGGGVR